MSVRSNDGKRRLPQGQANGGHLSAGAEAAAIASGAPFVEFPKQNRDALGVQGAIACLRTREKRRSGWSPDNRGLRQLLLQPLHPLLSHPSQIDVELLQIGHASEVLDARIGDSGLNQA